MADYYFRLLDPKDIKAHPPETEQTTTGVKRKLETIVEGQEEYRKRQREIDEEIEELKKAMAMEKKLKDLETESQKINVKLNEQDEEIKKALNTINNIDTRVSANKVAIEELKKGQPGTTTLASQPMLSGYKDAAAAAAKKTQIREDRKTTSEFNYYAGETVIKATQPDLVITNVMRNTDDAMTRTTSIPQGQVKDWINALSRMAEITPIPRQWWEEDEKWLKELENYDKDKMRPLALKLLVNKYMREGLGFNDENINRMWNEEIIAVWPTLVTERKETRPNSLIIVFNAEGTCNVFTTRARPRQIAIGNQKTLKLKVRLVCPLLFRQKYNLLMKEGAAFKARQKQIVDDYWAKKKAGEEMDNTPRPFGLAYKVGYTEQDLVLYTATDLDSNGDRKWELQKIYISLFRN